MLGFAFVGILLASVLVPWMPRMPTSGLDPSWRSVLEWGFLNAAEFGRDLVFTFGPLGFLYTQQFHPDLFVYQLAYWIAIAVALGAFFSRYWAASPFWVSLLFSMALLPAATVSKDSWLFFLPFATAIAAFAPRGQKSRWLIGLLFVLSVVSGLTKFTGFLVAAGTFLTVDLGRLAQRRLVPIYTLAFIAFSWLAFGAITGEMNWLAYLEGGFQVASGYSGAMQIDKPTSHVLLSVVASLGTVGWLTWGYARLLEHKSVVSTIVVSLSAVLFAFIAFKAGIVRQDGHFLITASGLLLLAITAGFLNFTHSPNLIGKIAASAMVALTIWGELYILRHYGKEEDVATIVHGIAKRPVTGLEQAVDLIVGGRYGELIAIRDNALSNIRDRYPLPHLAGTVDIYPWDQAWVLAQGLDYNPRPVFQSYSAYTPTLIERNYRHLIASHGPAYVLFEPKSIDGRLVSLMDGKSWRALLAKFDPVSVVQGHLLFRRRSRRDRQVTERPYEPMEVTWDERLLVPETKACVWAEVEIKQRSIGRIVPVAFKAPLVEIIIETTDGESLRYRFVPGMGKTGFLLSPLVTDASSLIDLCSHGSSDAMRKANAVSFSTTKLGRLVFEPAVKVRLADLSVDGAREHSAARESVDSIRW